jgi:uncharacterized membrane protein (DUF485 family)
VSAAGDQRACAAGGASGKARASVTFEDNQRRQLRLSVSLAVVFLVSVFAVPLLNYAAPEAMLTPVLGMPFVWLYVGVLLHLEFWTIAFVYAYFSNRWERTLRGDQETGDE